MITVKHKGSFKNTERFFTKMQANKDPIEILNDYGPVGVDILRQNTPRDSGKTAECWDWKLEDNGDGKYTLCWTNSNTNKGVSVALLLIFGHGNRDGTYVEGHDFASPAMRPLFEQIANEIWNRIRET